MIGAVFAGLFGVMLSMSAMAMRYVGMVAGLFVVPRGVMLGGGAMVLRGVLVVLRGFQMVLFTFFRHGFLFLRYGSRVEDTPAV
jgi:hypothetical protein